MYIDPQTRLIMSEPSERSASDGLEDIKRGLAPKGRKWKLTKNCWPIHVHERRSKTSYGASEKGEERKDKYPVKKIAKITVTT